jgi:TRAP-type uncharacterized transport system substrate-binding protein
MMETIFMENVIRILGKRLQKFNTEFALTKAKYPILAPGGTGCWKTQETMENLRTPWALKEDILRPYPCLCS